MSQEVKFQNIIDWINRNIEEGNWKAGDRLPTENAIAEQFGVSRQTVRRALDVLKNDHVVEKTQGSGTYVCENARKTQMARKKHFNIAVISTYIDHYIFPSVLRGIESVLASKGYMLQLFLTNDSIHHERTILKSLIERNDVDGIIVEPSKSALPNPNIELYKKLQDMGIPFLYFHTTYPELDFPCVRIDDTDVAYRATELLIHAGHKNIAGIFNAEDGQGRLRYTGFLKAMWDHHLSTNAKKTLWLDTDMMGNLEAIEDYLFGCLEDVTSVVCYNDEIAFELVNLAQKRNIKVPEELSVVGIDDSDLTEMCSVPLTSFVHPKEELGKKVGENMLRMIEDSDYDGNYLFDARPVIRKSIVPPKKKNTVKGS